MGDASVPQQPDDLITGFRLRMYMIFGFVTVLFVSPFTVNHFLQGRIAMALLTFSILIVAGANTLWILRHKRQLVPLVLFFPVMQATLIAGLFLQGVTIVFWFFPSALIILSIAERHHARMMIIISVILLIPAAFYALSMEFAVRFVVSYIMVAYLGDVIVRLLDSVQEQQARLATTDPLTGAYNRRHMMACVADAAEACRRGMGTASLIALDVDHFKSINDSLGHEAGDKALKGLVDTLLQRKRKLDEVFRTGGEEFVILTHDIEAGQATAFAESLRLHVEQANILDGQTMTVSIGVADYENNESIEAWIRRADVNLYQAKERGRNCVWPAPTFTYELKSIG
ncbi:MAG: GGDEF domain-containing protein [Porticoccaceae bacterium]